MVEWQESTKRSRGLELKQLPSRAKVCYTKTNKEGVAGELIAESIRQYESKGENTAVPGDSLKGKTFCRNVRSVEKPGVQSGRGPCPFFGVFMKLRFMFDFNVRLKSRTI